MLSLFDGVRPKEPNIAAKLSSVLGWNLVVSPTVCSLTRRVDSLRSYMSVYRRLFVEALNLNY